MAPLDQRMDTELLASPSFTHSADRTMPIIKSEQNVQETKSNLLFGCLDMFQFWSPCPSDSSPAKGNTDDHQSTSSRSSATEICDDDPQYTRISDPHLDVNSNPSHPIILQSIVSYPGSEAGVAGTPANLDTYLTSKNSQDSWHHALQDNENGSELSFSYSSFSENEEKGDLASTGDESVISFDPSDFLEDDQDELAKEESALQMNKLGTIMECIEEFSSRTSKSVKKQRSR